MTMALLRFERVGKSYRRGGGETVPGVRDIDLEVRDREAVGIFGPSGAGKSTLARLAIGFERPDRGRVRFRHRDLAELGAEELWSLRRSIQIVWQDPAVYLSPYQSAVSSVAEPLEVFRIGSREERVRRAHDLMDLVELPPSARDRRPYELSGGQCQRVAIARALAPGPRLLVCDEALASLDLSQQVRMVELLARLRDELALSLLFISHDRAVARALCDRLCRMCEGRLEAAGGDDDGERGGCSAPA